MKAWVLANKEDESTEFGIKNNQKTYVRTGKIPDLVAHERHGLDALFDPALARMKRYSFSTNKDDSHCFVKTSGLWARPTCAMFPCGGKKVAGKQRDVLMLQPQVRGASHIRAQPVVFLHMLAIPGRLLMLPATKRLLQGP